MTYRYRIRDWTDHFENHRTRDMEFMRWISIPNKQHGMGFTRIMAQIDGATIYGIWHLIVGACSQQKAPRCGWLTENGRADGTPWTIEDLAMRWRRQPEEVARALDVLCSPNIGWIETIEESAGETRGDRGVNAKEGKEGKEVAEGTDGSAAVPLSEEQQKAANRNKIRSTLIRLRMGSNATGVDQWIDFLKDAGCQTIEECVDCLVWVKRQGRKAGQKINWAREADGLELQWLNRPRLVAKETA